jgi:hypothetical protein
MMARSCAGAVPEENVGRPPLTSMRPPCVNLRSCDLAWWWWSSCVAAFAVAGTARVTAAAAAAAAVAAAV